MGYSLLPGHKSTANAGWNEINLKTDLLDTLDVGKLSLGNYGNAFSPNKDKHAAHYAIPNPWAAAYLYHSILKMNEHQLTSNILEMFLALLNDYHNYNKLCLRRISQPTKDSPFYNIWDMAPEFIKYDGNIFVFMDNEEKHVYGGLSRSTLVWVSQNYQHNYSLDDLVNDSSLKSFLTHIKDTRNPESIHEMEFNTFWANRPLMDMIEQAGERHSEYEIRDESPCEWLVGKQQVSGAAGYKGNKYLFEDALVFDKEINDDSSILGFPNPENFKQLLFEKKSGNELPLNQGKIRWTLFKDLFEEGWIRLTSLEGTDGPKGITYSGAYAYPIKPQYLQYGFDPEKMVERSMSALDTDVAASNICQAADDAAKQYKYRINCEVENDDRGIAVWPRFKSKILPAHIIEYNIDGFDNVPLLEFFGSDGTQLEYTLILKKKRTRLYRMSSNEQFPDYIRITSKNNISGITKVKHEDLTPLQDEMTVSIDFGSTHTTVGFSQENQPPQVMNFSESPPLIIADGPVPGALLEYFVPDGLLSEPPKTLSIYQQLKKVWSPFRTIWRHYPGTGNEFLSRGNIPICLTPEFVFEPDNDIKESLKWDSKADYRDGFLEQLIIMVLVECEAMGVNNAELRWSYPRSFSTKEQNSMHRFFERMQERYGLNGGDFRIKINPRGFSEAISAMDYFIHHESEFTTRNLVASIDVGGGTSDITFIKDRAILWEDSVKFGGDDIKNSLHHIKKLINTYRAKNHQKTFPTPFDYSKFISTWPGISSDWDGQMDDFIHEGSADSNLFFHKLGLFYSACFYYLGMHLKRKEFEAPLHMISLAGNGTQFLRVVSHGGPVNSENASAWYDLFKGVLSDAQGIPDISYTNSTILFSADPKKEVAYGMIYSKQNNLDGVRPEKVEKMIGLNCVINGNNYEWLNPIPPHTCAEIDTSKIDYTQFMHFLNSFYDRIQTSEMAEYMAVKNLATEVSDADLASFQNEISNYLERRSEDELATPLFFLAVKVWIDRLEKLV
jgi:hypothetical protein